MKNDFNYKWSKLFASKRYVTNEGVIKLTPEEQQELLNDSEKLFKANSVLGDVSEILGYFDYMGDRWHISEIDGEMLKGWWLTPKGKKHTLHIHSDNVQNFVECSR